LLLPLFLGGPAALAAQLPPVTFEEATELVTSKVPATPLESIAAGRCFGFGWNPMVESHLRGRGAGRDVLRVIRDACKRLEPPRFAGTPRPPRPDRGSLVPRTATYQIRGRPDTVMQRIFYQTLDGLNVLRFRSEGSGPGRGMLAETIVDADSYAPVSYDIMVTDRSDTSRVTLWRLSTSVIRATRARGEAPSYVRYNAQQGTLFPGTAELLLLSAPALAVGQRFVLPTFVNSTGEPCLLNMEVQRATEVTVPAGTFPAWQVRVSGSGCGPAFRMYVNKDAIPHFPPRVILATEGSGYRVELTRVELD
jgi:hypothetical protein